MRRTMMKASLRMEDLEQRTVLSASAVVAADALVAVDNGTAAIATEIESTTTDVSSSIEMLEGDFNIDGKVDAEDIDMLCAAMHSDGESDSSDMFDLNGSGEIDQSDMDFLIRDVIGTEYGDGNLDGQIDTLDMGFGLINMFKSVDDPNLVGTTNWRSGDFTCDGFIDGRDFIMWNQYKGTITKLGTDGESMELADPGETEKLDAINESNGPAIQSNEPAIARPFASMSPDSPVLSETSEKEMETSEIKTEPVASPRLTLASQTAVQSKPYTRFAALTPSSSVAAESVGVKNALRSFFAKHRG